MTAPTPKPTVRELVLRACKVARVCEKDVFDGSRYNIHVEPRFAAIYVAHMNGAGLSHIARQLGRDHTSVMNAVARSKERLASDDRFRGIVAAISDESRWRG